MKAFIVLALVAVAAARSVDVDTLRLLSKEKSLLSRENLLLKDGLFGHRFVPHNRRGLLNSYDYSVPSTSYYGGDVDDVESYYQRRVTILSFEELVQTPLFREYLEIPLFRQLLEEHPTVFRRYVESPLFQQFYTIPQFQQYFRNPIFFYKYIVPQIQVIAHSLPYTTSEGVYDKYYPTGSRYNYDVEDYIGGRGVERRGVTVQDYLNRIYNHHGIERSTYSPYYPYSSVFSTGERYTTPFGGRTHYYGQGLNGVSHKFLLDKIYRTLFANQPSVGEVTQVRTDVKVSPAHKEVVVEPITGESRVVLEPTKIVDVKVDEKIIPQSHISTSEVEEHIYVKEAILKRLLVNKVISHELYTVLRTLPLHHVREIVHRIVPTTYLVAIFGDDVTTYFPNYRSHFGVEDIDNVDYNDATYRNKIWEIVNRLYKNEFVGDRYTPEVRDLFRVLGHHNTVREYPTIRDIIRA